MPIKWSAVKVTEAMEKVKEHADQIIEPLKLAKLAADEALKIEHLPQYMEQRLRALAGEIDRVTGGKSSWDSGKEYSGNIHRSIQSVLDDIPEDAINAEERRGKHGRQQTLIE